MPVTINGNGSITGLAQGGIDGTKVVTASAQPAGAILQTVQGFAGNKTVTTTSANGDAVECPASVSITPSSASNKILIHFHASFIHGNANDVGFWLLRNGTVIGNSQRTTENNVCFSVASMPTDYDDWKPQTISFNFLDDAQNTSAHTYTVKGAGIQGAKTNANKALPKVGAANNEEMTWGGSTATSGNESNAGNMVIIAQEIKG